MVIVYPGYRDTPEAAGRVWLDWPKALPGCQLSQCCCPWEPSLCSTAARGLPSEMSHVQQMCSAVSILCGCKRPGAVLACTAGVDSLQQTHESQAVVVSVASCALQMTRA